MIVQDMQAGRGVIVLESKGALYYDVLDRIPSHRAEDVILIDVTDTQYPPGFNILQGRPAVVAADIQRLFDHLYPMDSRGVRVRQGMFHAVLTLMTSKNAPQPMTFADIVPLCVPREDQVAFSDYLTRGIIHDEELAAFWQDVENKEGRETYFGPLLNRVWQLNGRRSIRNIIGQSSSTINLEEAIRQRKIILINTGRSTEGVDVAGLMGSIFLNAIWSAVRSHPLDLDNPLCLYLDEVQDLVNLPVAPEEMLNQGRGMGMSITMAHQYLKQFKDKPAMLDAIMNSARTKMTFACGGDDARVLAREYGYGLTDADFMHLGQHSVLAKVATGSTTSGPITGVTRRMADVTANAARVRAHSR